MKRLILTAVILSCATLLPLSRQANADSLGINKDCANHPVSQYGMDSITKSSLYKAESKKITKAMTAFCNKGKTMGDMGFDAATKLSHVESKKWTDANLPGQNEEQIAFSDGVANLLHFAMLNGFSGFDYPKPPEQKEVPLAATSFNPNEICDSMSAKAAEYSTSRLPPQVQISLAEWNQVKNEFQMVCLTGIIAGNRRQPVDTRITSGMNDIGRDVYSQAYNIGSSYPKLSAHKNVSGVDDLLGDLSSSKGKVDSEVNEKSRANSESKPAIAKPLSQKEIKERQEIQSYGMEIRNAFGQIRSGAPDLTGQKCSIKVWFSQSGNVLSTKVESGDNDACSYVLKRTQKIKLSAMNDSQYKVFRNTPIDFSF